MLLLSTSVGFYPWKMLRLKVLEVSSESRRILDETWFEGSCPNTHTLFQQKMVLLEERTQTFLTTVWSAPGWWQIPQVLLIVWWSPTSSFLSRVHPGIAQATALALQSCLEEGLIWAPLVPKLFHFRLLQGSVASSYCAIWIRASRRDTALSGMLIRLLRWPIWGDKSKGEFTPQTSQLFPMTRFGNMWRRCPRYENLVSIQTWANRQIWSQTTALPQIPVLQWGDTTK